jgi:hypothetical protein
MRREHWVVLIPFIAAHHAGSTAATAVDRAAPPPIIVELLGLDDHVIPTITPTITIRATLQPGDSPPVALGVRASTSPLALGQIVLDTSVAASDSAQIRLMKPLPSGATLYFRSYARTADGTIIQSAPSPPRLVPRWLTLVSPNAPNGAILEDQTPRFVWSSARVGNPPGPWTYEFSVVHTAGGPPIFSTTTTDTSLTFPFLLDFNTSYRWAVTASLQDQSTQRVTSTSSFVVIDETLPRVTLLYQTFPNPFPSLTADFACIWFDLAESASVTLDVLDIRTNLVTRIFPRPGGSTAPLAPGKYGRAVNSASLCSGDFTWDGTDQRGRSVIPGLYLLRMRTGGREFVRRMLFEGR